MVRATLTAAVIGAVLGGVFGMGGSLIAGQQAASQARQDAARTACTRSIASLSAALDKYLAAGGDDPTSSYDVEGFADAHDAIKQFWRTSYAWEATTSQAPKLDVALSSLSDALEDYDFEFYSASLKDIAPTPTSSAAPSHPERPGEIGIGIQEWNRVAESQGTLRELCKREPQS